MKRNYIANKGYATGVDNKVSAASPHKLTLLLYSEVVKNLRDAITCISQIKQYRGIADALMENREETFGAGNREAILKRAQVMRELNRITATKGAYLTKANNITAYLRNTLHDEAYPELCNDLRKLYLFIEYKTTHSIINDDETAVHDALSIATELLNTWNMIPAKYHHLTNARR